MLKKFFTIAAVAIVAVGCSKETSFVEMGGG